MRQILQSATKCYYKVRQVLQSASGITKCDRNLLQSASGITKCDSYYKVRQHNLLSTLMKKSKSDYYTNFLTKNTNDLKITRKGIKTII